MKKLFGLSLISLLVLTGCGSSNSLTCTGSAEENGQKVEMELKADFDKDDKLESVKATMTFDDEETAKQMCSLFELANGAAEDDQKIDYECSGKKVTIKGYEKMLEMEGTTKEEFKKEMESEEDVTCK